MNRLDPLLARRKHRRRLLGRAALGTIGLAASPTQKVVDLRLPGGNARHPPTSGYPVKSHLTLQHVDSSLLEF